MSGRAEAAIKTREKIESKLKYMPEVVSDYYTNLSSTKEPRTCDYYIDAIIKMTRYMTNTPKDFDYNTIKEPDMAKYMNSICYHVVKGVKKETSFSHRKTVWTALNSFFGYLKKRKYIDDNPMDYIERSNKKDEIERPRLEGKDLAKILQAIEDGKTETGLQADDWIIARNKAIYLLFVTTGMRRSALSQIDIDDINFDEKKLKIIDKGYKTFYYDLDDRVMMAINNWLKMRILKFSNIESNALFLGAKGNRLQPERIEDMIGHYSKQALGFPISPHKLRAAYCTLYYEATGDIYKVQQAVKHASVVTTQRYIVSKTNYQQEASDLILRNME